MSLWLQCPEAVWTQQPSPPPALINHYGTEPHLSSWSETSNERRDHDSALPQKYFIKSTFKHTTLGVWPHWWAPPYHIWMINSRPNKATTNPRGPHIVLPPESSAGSRRVSSVERSGSFLGSWWLLWGLVTFALMLYLWWPVTEEDILVSQTQVVSLDDGPQLLHNTPPRHPTPTPCCLLLWKST